MTVVPRYEFEYTSTLSKEDILSCREIGAISIEPFNIDDLGTNSYDVRLGDWFYRESKPYTTTPIYNVYDPQHVDRVWGDPLAAQTYQSLIAQKLLPKGMHSLNQEDKIILLSPGETILAHTQEFIGGRLIANERIGISTAMHCRSSFGRSMIGVCKCAGFGDVGYVNRWTMEITSFSRNHVIPLVVGRRIAQIEFIKIVNIDEQYSDKGKYQKHTSMKDIMESWCPQMMLPRLSQEREIQTSPTSIKP